MQNGDTYNGTLLSVTSNVLVLQSENLGTLRLPRAKVAATYWGAAATTNTTPGSSAPHSPVAHPVTPPADATTDPKEAFRGIGSQTNLIQEVQTRILGSASPEATAKFHELLDGLSTGKMDMTGLRAEAQSAADQLRAFRKDLGPEAGGQVDSYLAILDHFLKETGSGGRGTNSR